jgi:hypothetical protein
MARLMLTLDGRPWLQRRTLQVFRRKPETFERLLALHVGALSPLAAWLWMDLVSDGDCSLPNFSLRTFSLRNFALRRFVRATNCPAGRKAPPHKLCLVLFVLLGASAAATAQQSTLQLDPAQDYRHHHAGRCSAHRSRNFPAQARRAATRPRRGKASPAKLSWMQRAATLAARCATARCTAKSWRASVPGNYLSSRPMEGAAQPGKIRGEGSRNFHDPRSGSRNRCSGGGRSREDHWTATLHFTIPYVKWGMKNPSALLLRVDESIDIAAAGTLSPSED